MVERLQRQLIIHSFIYYKLNNNIWSDSDWDQAALKLLALKKENPEEFKKSKFYSIFKDFDGSTGFDLVGTNVGYWNHLAEQLLDSVSEYGIT